MQTFSVTPDEDTTVVDDGDTNPAATDDNVVFEVENPVAGESHDIILVDADLVDVDDNGAVTFLDANGDPEDDWIQETGTLTSDISVVNGSAFGGADDQYASATPVGGNLTFTVDANGYEEFVAVVFFDEDGDTRLDLDDNGQPIEDEAFGVSGVISVLPPEMTNGDAIDGSAIMAVNKDENYVVVDTGDIPGVTGDAVVYYEEGDTFYVGGTTAGDQVTMADFEDVLTAGDSFAAGSEYSRNFDSTFELTNSAPAELDIESVDASDSAIEVTVGDEEIVTGATIEVWLIEDGEVGGDTAGDDPAFSESTWTLAAESATDEDDDTDDFEITAEGLDDSTIYDVAVRQVVDGEASEVTGDPNGTPVVADGESIERDVATDAAPGDLTIESIAPNELNDGNGNTDSFTIIFSDDVAFADSEAATIALMSVYATNQPNITYTIEDLSDPAGATDTLVVTLVADDEGPPAVGPLYDADTDVSYTVEVDSGAFVDSDGDPNGDLEDTFQY